MYKPKVRFKNFNEDWEQRKLGELTSLITKGTTPHDKSGIGNINFIKVENIDSVSGEIKETSKISTEEHEGYLRRSQLQEGDILFSIAGTLGRVTTVNKRLLPANTNQALAIIRLKEGCLEFIKTCLKGNVVADFIRKNPTIGAQPNLSLEQVSSLEIIITSNEEQEKIGSYFHILDNLITLHRRKCDEVKTLKKYMLQNMFPQNGESVPKIRFKGFTDAWKQRKLGDVLIRRKINRIQSKEYPRLAFASGQGVIPLSERKTNNREQLTKDEFTKKYLVTELNDIVYNPANVKYGAIDRNKYGRGLISPIYVTFTTTENPAYIERIVTSFNFQQRALQFEEGSVTKRQQVSPEDLCTLEVYISMSQEEQNRIGTYFDYIDNLITLHRQKCEELQNFKKFMLQNMFV
ncbi:MAG: restriction endonuclease subunit S [Clostridiales bacterium]|nr:restriction endonuclease subunit S [Clostridiales bacterium]